MTSILNYSSETLVNTATTGAQSAQHMAVLSDGRYVITWQSPDTSGTGVFARIYNAAGYPEGNAFRVNTTLTNSQSRPVVGALADGGFVIVWTSDVAGGKSVLFQKYDYDGSVSGTETIVNTAASSALPNHASVTGLYNGGFVVTWDQEPDAGGDAGMVGRTFTPNGIGGAVFDINLTTAGAQFYSDTALLDDGSFVVVWQDSSAGNPNVVARRYNDAGSALSSEFVITTDATSQSEPKIAALANGGYVIVWYGDGPGDGSGVFFQTFDNSGTATSGITLAVSSASALLYTQDISDVTALSDGGFIIGWSSGGQDGSSYGIYSQRFDDMGNPIGPEIRLNQTTTGAQDHVALAALPDGGFVASWTSSDGDGTGIFSRTFKAASSLVGTQYLYGTSEADTLDGGSGNDQMYGGKGGDTYVINSAGDVILELPDGGIDTVRSSTMFTLPTNVENLVLTGLANLSGDGNSLDNIILGNDGKNVINGLDGSDIIYGYGGDDVLRGDLGVDHIYGGDGSDFISGGVGFDYLYGEDGDDFIHGGEVGGRLDGGRGNDYIYSGLNGYNQIYGGDGDDTIILRSGSFGSVSGDAGFDIMLATDFGSAVDINLLKGQVANRLNGLSAFTISGIEFFTGSVYDDILTGNASDNKFDGFFGNDVLEGGLGNDTLDGGENTDTASYAGSTAAVNVSLALQGLWQDTGGAGIDYLTNIENLTGSRFVDTLTGDAYENVLDGLGGADIMAGGDGDDTYIVGNSSDVVIEYVAEGLHDKVVASVSYVLAETSYVEDLELTGTAAINATGNSLANILTGNSGINILDGLAGADTMIGGGGNDIYYVDNTGDIVTEISGGGSDTIRTSVTYTLSSQVEDMAMLGTAAINGTGNGANNLMIGNSGNNTLSGINGADRLNGKEGDDTLIGGTGADNLTGDIGADKFVFSAASVNGLDTIVDFVSGTDDLVFTGADYGFAAGVVLNATQYRVANAPVGTNAQFYYNATTHTLFFDADGTNAGAAFALATFSNNATPIADDFVFV